MDAMQARPTDVSIGDALSRGWEALKAHPVPAILGFFIYALITGIGGAIPYVGVLFTLLVRAPFDGGLATLSLHLSREESPQVEDIFAGFKKYGKFLGVFWVFTLVFIACFFPAIIAAVFGGIMGLIMRKATVAFGLAMGLAVLFGLIGLVIYIFIIVRWLFAYYLIVDRDDLTVMTALRESARLTEGYRLSIFLAYFVIGLVGALGILACCVGVFITGPIASTGTASVYEQMKLIKGWTTVEPVPQQV